MVIGWTPEGRILFRGQRNFINGFVGEPYTVSPQGGPVERFPLPESGILSFAPDGKRIKGKEKGFARKRAMAERALRDLERWLDGDPEQPAPPDSRQHGRNHEWPHLFNRDVISMPDKWEYPWYAAWDLAFHMLPMARVDGEFAKDQLLLFLREWYMHPNGQIPAYEFAFGDVNPPVHAWACWRVYKMTGARGERDRTFLRRAFHKLLINFTWWVNRKDPQGRNLFAGGFLGLDNIGVFDRSQPLPGGHQLEQADGTAWMAFYCATMLSMALELAADDPSYEDIASKFFEHFVAITDAMNSLGGMGLWDEQDGFYYDVLNADGTALPLRIRSMVGIIPLFAVEVLEEDGDAHAEQQSDEKCDLVVPDVAAGKGRPRPLGPLHHADVRGLQLFLQIGLLVPGHQILVDLLVRLDLAFQHAELDGLAVELQSLPLGRL